MSLLSKTSKRVKRRPAPFYHGEPHRYWAGAESEALRKFLGVMEGVNMFEEVNING